MKDRRIGGGHPTLLADGLYAVVRPDWAAGFVVERGRVTMCAPILRKQISFWTRHAKRVPGARTDTQ